MYKCSNYNVIVDQGNNKYLLFNTLTQGLTEIDKETKDDLLVLNLDSKYTDQFIKYGFWISKDRSEIDELKFKHRDIKFNSKDLRITLKTTNNCNFLCKYCYQPHKIKTLTNDNIQSILKFISNELKNGKDRVLMHYFGGEPLLNFNAILQIDKYLRENNINNKSSMTTNGYLLNNDIIMAIKDTNIKTLQITVDGTKETHNNTRPLKDGSQTFDVIINNIKNVLELTDDVKIILRFNVNKITELKIDEFLQFLKDNNLKSKRILLRFEETHESGTNYTNQKIYYKDREEFSKKLLNINSKVINFGQRMGRHGVRGVYCAFDRIGSYIINTNLELENCTFSDKVVGVLDKNGLVSYNENFYKRILREPFEDEECVKCKILPMCMGGCTCLHAEGHIKCLHDKYILEGLIKQYKESAEKFGIEPYMI